MRLKPHENYIVRNLEKNISIIQAFQDKISEQNVILEAEKINLLAGTTFDLHHQIFAILTPENKAEVMACVAIANKYQIAVYPVSRGLNWGYGLVTSSEHPGIILDLHKLNKIVNFNEKLAYVVIEPGVSFQQLAEFLVSNNSELMLSATGSSPETSIIGNTLERGIGKGSHGDRAQFICGLEIILPTGECIQTSFGRFDGAAATHVNRAGLGPCVDGLFLQSNLGIVTQMTIWLKPIPAYLQVITFSINNESRLMPLLNQLQHIALHGYAETGYTIFNDYKMLMAATQYPWEETQGQTPIHSDIKDALTKELSLPAWKGQLQIRSPSIEIGNMQRLLLMSQLNDYVDEVTHLTSSKEQSIALLKQYFAKKSQTSYDKILLRHLGISCGTNISSVYWRMKTLPPQTMQPAIDGCGLLWVCPVVPFTADHILNALTIVTKTMLHYCLEPAISISVISDKCVVLVISIVFDKTIQIENNNANHCKDNLFSALAVHGYHPYRVPANVMHLSTGDNPHYSQLLGKIKTIMDPNNILAPGRYITIDPS